VNLRKDHYHTDPNTLNPANFLLGLCSSLFFPLGELKGGVEAEKATNSVLLPASPSGEKGSRARTPLLSRRFHVKMKKSRFNQRMLTPKD
jgi:hypothetical protein